MLLRKRQITEVAGRYEGMDLATCKAKTIEDLKVKVSFKTGKS